MHHSRFHYQTRFHHFKYRTPYEIPYIWNIGSQDQLYMHFPIHLNLCKMKSPLVGIPGFILMCKLYKPYPKDAVFQISEYKDCQFMRRSSNIHKFYPFLGPIGSSPLIVRKLESPFPQRCFLPNMVQINQFNGFGEVV